MPVLIFSGVYILLGIFYGFLGIKIGRKLRNEQDLYRPERSSSTFSSGQNQQRGNFDYSLNWLFVDVILLIGSLLLLSFFPWEVWSIAIILIGTIWATRYKRAFRQIARPKFWIYFVFITMLVAFVFNGDSTAGERVLIGLQMNFRAVVIIMGFSVLGTELYHPKIREFFKRRSFEKLSMALELSFESLPSAVANLPNVQSFFRKPMTLFVQLLSGIEGRLAEMKKQKLVHPQIFILSGERGQGKTGYAREIINLLRQKGVSVNGIYSDRVLNDDETIGYDIVDIKSGEREIFLRLTGEPQFERIGRYYIHLNGLRMGINSLLTTSSDCDIVVIDEVGQLELKDRGWSDSLNQLIHNNQSHILLTTRTRYADELISRLDGANIFVYDLSAYRPEAIGHSVLSHIRTE
jgi:nucleoside-triphosphatase THEP1